MKEEAVFTVLLCQLNHEVDSVAQYPLVTDAPTHSRWLKVATKQNCI